MKVKLEIHFSFYITKDIPDDQYENNFQEENLVQTEEETLNEHENQIDISTNGTVPLNTEIPDDKMHFDNYNSKYIKIIEDVFKDHVSSDCNIYLSHLLQLTFNLLCYVNLIVDLNENEEAEIFNEEKKNENVKEDADAKKTKEVEKEKKKNIKK